MSAPVTLEKVHKWSKHAIKVNSVDCSEILAQHPTIVNSLLKVPSQCKSCGGGFFTETPDFNLHLKDIAEKSESMIRSLYFHGKPLCSECLSQAPINHNRQYDLGVFSTGCSWGMPLWDKGSCGNNFPDWSDWPFKSDDAKHYYCSPAHMFLGNAGIHPEDIKIWRKELTARLDAQVPSDEQGANTEVRTGGASKFSMGR